MRLFAETASDALFIRQGVIGKFSKDLGRTTHLATWADDDPSDILLQGTSLYVLTSVGVSRVEADGENFGAVTWTSILPATPLRLSVTGEGYLRVLMMDSGDLVSGLFNATNGSPVSYTNLVENVGDSTVLDLADSVFVLGERTSAPNLVVRYYGTSSWASTFETFGEIQDGRITLKFIDDGQYILLGYNEQTEEGGWDPRIILISPQTGLAVWTSSKIFSTRGSDTLSGVFSDPLASDIYLIYSADSGLMRIARLNKQDGSTVYNLPVPSLSDIFPSSQPPEIIASTLDNSGLNVFFSSSAFVNGFDNSHTGTHYGLVRFSVTEPLPANSVPDNIAITEYPSFSFDPSILSYDLTLQNTSNSVSFSATLLSGQILTIRVNGRVIQGTSFLVPVGRTLFELLITAGRSSTTYSFNVVRETVISGPTYVNMATGTATGRGTAQYPIKNLNQAMKLVNRTLVLRVKDLLPLAPDTSFEVTPVKTSGSISKNLGVNTVRLKNPDSDKVYALGVMPALRGSIGGKNSILTFFIKVYNEETDQFVQDFTPMDLEFNLPNYFSRSSLRLYREEPNGTTSEVDGGVVKTVNSLFTRTLGSNSVYTVTDSDAIIPTAGIGSDPHITTLFGETYTLLKLSKYGKRLSILKTPYGQISGKVTGLRNGEFLDSADILVGGERVLGVKFGKSGSKIRICDPSRVREIPNVNVAVDSFKTSSRLSRVFVVKDLWEGGMYLFVNGQHRYVCPIPISQPTDSQRHLFSGLLGGTPKK